MSIALGTDTLVQAVAFTFTIKSLLNLKGSCEAVIDGVDSGQSDLHGGVSRLIEAITV